MGMNVAPPLLDNLIAFIFYFLFFMTKQERQRFSGIGSRKIAFSYKYLYLFMRICLVDSFKYLLAFTFSFFSFCALLIWRNNFYKTLQNVSWQNTGLISHCKCGSLQMEPTPPFALCGMYCATNAFAYCKNHFIAYPYSCEYSLALNKIIIGNVFRHMTWL